MQLLLHLVRLRREIKQPFAHVADGLVRALRDEGVQVVSTFPFASFRALVSGVIDDGPRST